MQLGEEYLGADFPKLQVPRKRLCEKRKGDYQIRGLFISQAPEESG